MRTEPRASKRDRVADWLEANGIVPYRTLSVRITPHLKLEVEQWVPHPVTGRKFVAPGTVDIATTTVERSMLVAP